MYFNEKSSEMFTKNYVLCTRYARFTHYFSEYLMKIHFTKIDLLLRNLFIYTKLKH